MLFLVNAHGDDIRLIEQNIAGHKHGVGEKTRVYVVRVFSGFVFELGHAGKLAELSGAAQNPVCLRMGGNMALDEKNAFVRVNSACHCKGI